MDSKESVAVDVDVFSVQNDLAKELASKLPIIRKEYQVSQRRMGELVGKSRQQISKIERGIAPLSWDTCLIILLLTYRKDEKLFLKLLGKKYLTNFLNYMDSEGL